MLPDGARTTAYGWSSEVAIAVRCPFAGSTCRTRPLANSTSSSLPEGSTSIDVGSVNTTGLAGALRTRTAPRREVVPPARAERRQRPGEGKTTRARYEPRRPVARTSRRRVPLAVRRTAPANEAGRTVSLTVHARPVTGAGRFPLRETLTGSAANAEQAKTATSKTAPAKRFM